VKRIRNWLIVKAAILFAVLALKSFDLLGAFLMPAVYLIGVAGIAGACYFVVAGASENTANSGTESYVFDRMAVPVMIPDHFTVADDNGEDAAFVATMCDNCRKRPSMMSVVTSDGSAVHLCDRCTNKGVRRG